MQVQQPTAVECIFRQNFHGMLFITYANLALLLAQLQQFPLQGVHHPLHVPERPISVLVQRMTKNVQSNLTMTKQIVIF